eukprot:3217490-Rhodomonas_salina.1
MPAGLALLHNKQYRKEVGKESPPSDEGRNSYPGYPGTQVPGYRVPGYPLTVPRNALCPGHGFKQNTPGDSDMNELHCGLLAPLPGSESRDTSTEIEAGLEALWTRLLSTRVLIPGYPGRKTYQVKLAL